LTDGGRVVDRRGVALAQRLLSRAAARELDRRAIEEYGIPALVLMENAGRACADAAAELLAGRAGPVLVLCGAGNNGGDGLVVARTLWNRGFEARVLLAGPLARLERASAEVQTNARLWQGLGRRIEPLADEVALAARAGELASAALLIDALFGTGLTRPLTGLEAACVRALDGAGPPLLAVDLPSGLDADTGEVLGAAPRAALTVTFVAAKRGLLRGWGPALAGRVRVAEIGVPRFLVEELSETIES
jgi:NAD(P)H-hydrate epimerase